MPFVPKLNKKADPKQRVDEELLNNIRDAIVGGCPHKIACTSYDLSYTHLKSMMAQAELDMEHGVSSIHKDFLQSLRAGERDVIRSKLKMIEESEKGHQGAQWYLERKHWRNFSSRAETLELMEEIEELKAQMAAQNKDKPNVA